MRPWLFNFLMWWAVIGFSIWLGGTIFSMTVIVPMWSESPPESVRNFFSTTSFNKHIFNFFGPPWMIARNLPLILALAVGWKSPLHRRFLALAVLPLIAGIIFTITYIYPVNEVLMINAGAGKSADEIRDLTDKWILADRLRFLVMLSGYYFLLKAFKLPNPFHPRSTKASPEPA